MIKLFEFLNNGHAAAMPWGGSLDWALVLTVVISAAIIGAIVVSLLSNRGRQFEARALWLSAAALLFAPLALLPVANFALLRYSKQESFCTSCHSVMQPYVDELHDGGSKALSARHFKDRFVTGTSCYTCHAGPGMHGMVRAKLTGLHEAYAYAIGNYQLPIKMAAPFPNSYCLQCHEGTRRFMADDSHLDADGKTAEDLLSGAVRCDECHGPSHMVNPLAQASSPAMRQSR